MILDRFLPNNQLIGCMGAFIINSIYAYRNGSFYRFFTRFCLHNVVKNV